MTSWLRHLAPALALLAAAGCDFGASIQGGGGTGVEGLSGTLVDGGGAPVAGAVVKAYAVADAEAGTLARRAATPEAALDSATTNHRGLFDLKRLAPGTYNLMTMIRIGDTTMALYVPDVVYAGGVQKLGTDTLKPAGGTSLQILDGDSLVTGAICRIPGTPYHARSDELGVCIFEFLPAGVFSIVVDFPGRATAAYEGVYVDAGAFSGCGSLDLATAEAVRIPAGWRAFGISPYSELPLILHAPSDMVLSGQFIGSETSTATFRNDSVTLRVEGGLVAGDVCSPSRPCADSLAGFSEEILPLNGTSKIVLIRHDPSDSTSAVVLYVVSATATRPWQPTLMLQSTVSGGNRAPLLALATSILKTLRVWNGPGPIPAPLPGNPDSLLLPAQNANITTSHITLVWNRAPHATAYHVEVSTTSTFATHFVNDSAVTDTALVIGPLQESTVYYWRVRGGNSTGFGERVAGTRRFTHYLGEAVPPPGDSL